MTPTTPIAFLKRPLSISSLFKRDSQDSQATLNPDQLSLQDTNQTIIHTAKITSISTFKIWSRKKITLEIGSVYLTEFQHSTPLHRLSTSDLKFALTSVSKRLQFTVEGYEDGKLVQRVYEVDDSEMLNVWYEAMVKARDCGKPVSSRFLEERAVDLERRIETVARIEDDVERVEHPFDHSYLFWKDFLRLVEVTRKGIEYDIASQITASDPE